MAALVVLLLPVAILSIGMVGDLGVVFFARKAVQAACDLGALAGVLELDWDRLAAGQVAIREQEGRAVAADLTRQNLESVSRLVVIVSLSTSVQNPPVKSEPVLTVEANFRVRTPFLGAIPGLQADFEGRVLAQASVVKRTKW